LEIKIMHSLPFVVRQLGNRLACGMRGIKLLSEHQFIAASMGGAAVDMGMHLLDDKITCFTL